MIVSFFLNIIDHFNEQNIIIVTVLHNQPQGKLPTTLIQEKIK